MNVEVFKAAQEAYAKGDYSRALEGFMICTRDVGGLSPADLSKFYHLIGNCYVKSNDPRSAAEYFLKALNGSPEKRKPSLYVNLGTALLGTKDYENALEAFGRALDYPIYATPYKAYAGVGAAQLKLGNMIEAGAAYREAALDPANPAPAKSLINLGVCFMELGRSEDAVTSYEAAIDFELDTRSRAKAYANLGQAYMAQGRIPKALDAFEKAQEEGEPLPSMAEHDYELAKTLKERLDSRVPGVLDTGYIPSPVAVAGVEEDEDVQDDPFAPKTQDPDEQPETSEGENAGPVDEDELNATLEELGIADNSPESAQVSAPDSDLDQDPSTAETVVMQRVDVGEEDAPDAEEGFELAPRESDLDDRPFTYNDEPGYEYGVAFDFGDEYADAREPHDMETTEMHMPSPENTAFFDVSEQEINKGAREGRRKKRRARGCGLKIAIFLVIICILLAAAACAAYVLGYGYPLQETVTDNFFTAVQNGEDTSKYWSDSVDQGTRTSQESSLAGLKSHQVEAVKRSTAQTEVFVDATLEEGGKIDYEVVLTRKGLSWAIEYVQLYFPSEQ